MAQALEARINSKQREINEMTAELLNNFKSKIAALQATLDRKEKIIKRLQSEWRTSNETNDELTLECAMLKAENDKIKAENDKLNEELSNGKAIDNKTTTTTTNARMEELIIENKELLIENNRLKAVKKLDRKKLKTKNLTIKQLKQALANAMEGVYNEFDDNEAGNVGDDGGADIVGDEAVIVDVDTDADVVMSDKADKSDENEEEKEEEFEGDKGESASTPSAEKLLEGSDTDPDESSFEVDDELIKAELKEKEKDEKLAAKQRAKEHKKKKGKSKKTKTKRKKSKKNKKAAKESSKEASMDVVDDEI